MTVHFHKHDIPADLTYDGDIAIDTETMGLRPGRDPLCVVQFSFGDGDAHIVQMDRETYDAPNLKKLFAENKGTKLFHFARFDVAIVKKYLGVICDPIYCTRSASKLVRTYTDRHGLRDCCKELLGVDLNKQQQSSYWGAEDLTEAQLQYAANDVLYLHALKAEFDIRLAREGRTELAARTFDAIHVVADLDLEGWSDTDFFAH
ncbi:MAG: ribonuclease D [Alphaproteobacteria bacterium]|nr:ribonuclease D [Alphaproteobacteria bacterium]